MEASISLTNSILSSLQPSLDMVARVAEEADKAMAPIREATKEYHKMMQPFLDEVAKQQKVFSDLADSIVSPFLYDFPSIHPQVELQPTLKISEPVKTAPTPVLIAQNNIQKVIFPIKKNKPVVCLPDNAEWKNVEMKWVNDRIISILYKGKPVGKYDWTTLDFARKNTNDERPNVAWYLFQHISLAIAKKTGPLTTYILARNIGKKDDAVAKQKELLSRTLCKATGITDDPFRYNSKTGYQPKFSIGAKMLLSGEELHRSGGNFHDETYSDDLEEEI